MAILPQSINLDCYNERMLDNIQYQHVTLPISTSRIALLSDTHTSKRCSDLHSNLVPVLKATTPDVIFHAGDICLPETLQSLEEIAPVIAVRGNRDLSNRLSHLPEACIIQLKQWKVLLTHGHAPMMHYLLDKLQYMHQGFRFSRYHNYLNSFCPDADLYFFGHTHVPFEITVGNKRYINPGSAGIPTKHDPFPTFMSILFTEDGISSKIEYL